MIMNKIDKYLNKIICGDALEVLKELPNNSIDLIITSPPYYKQRNYGGLGIGDENTIDEYISNLIIIFKECVRIIKDTGSIVFNIGDKYENRNLLLIPYRFALEVIKIDKIKLINELTWVKLNPTPKQDKRKLVSSTEPFFIFVKSNNYFFDKDAFLDFQDYLRSTKKRNNNNVGKKYFELIKNSDLTDKQKKLANQKLLEVIKEVKEDKIKSFRMKIKGIHAEAYGGQAGGRQIHIERDGFTIIRIHGKAMKKDIIESSVETIKGNFHPAVYPKYIIQEFLKLLTKEENIVLDPFMGSGTTGVVAKKMNRNFIGIEINSKYCDYATKRIIETQKTNIQEIIL